MSIAATIIRDEHRALASVIKGLQFLIQEIQNRGQKPDFALLQAIVSYVEQFPDKLHHPKEDQYLFPALRLRYPASATDLDILQDEHERGAAVTTRVVETLREYAADPARFEAFAQAVDDYANFHWAHMHREENVILPLAEAHLTPQDWTQINAAFKSNSDPLVGINTQREFRELFRRLVNIIPAPYGLGAEHR
ncbi:MAG: hemerythrin domain-containing protein [Simplicispira sp.]|uniref:hemerythrin domain-containing protein n=1 Tax=Simplicispira sp. TaxID=2015802 RepID=UPI002588921A|nr:hemerythrin domain-containing protein [Simplicispira sp.]MDD2692613.1 hemerythrin domain-containing protein [Simplicispira sp.]